LLFFLYYAIVGTILSLLLLVNHKFTSLEICTLPLYDVTVLIRYELVVYVRDLFHGHMSKAEFVTWLLSGFLLWVAKL